MHSFDSRPFWHRPFTISFCNRYSLRPHNRWLPKTHLLDAFRVEGSRCQQLLYLCRPLLLDVPANLHAEDWVLYMCSCQCSHTILCWPLADMQVSEPLTIFGAGTIFKWVYSYVWPVRNWQRCHIVTGLLFPATPRLPSPRSRYRFRNQIWAIAKALLW